MDRYISGMHHLAILCSNKEKSLKFYEALGFTVTESHKRIERHDEIIMLCGYGLVLELFIDASHPMHVSNPEAYGVRHLALSVAEGSLEKAIDILSDADFEVEKIRRDTFNGKRMTFVKDPDGLPIELHE